MGPTRVYGKAMLRSLSVLLRVASTLLNQLHVYMYLTIGNQHFSSI